MKIKELELLIIKHKSLYYDGKAVLSDEEYDKIEDQLRKIDPNNPTLEIVGSNIFSSAKVKHDKPMKSLAKTYKESDLKKWINTKTLATYKIDGISCSLIYKNGKLTLAKTRGNGTFGENITEKVLYMLIPKVISDKRDLEIRGEIFCRKDNFLKLATEMKKREMDTPKSERNIVAGLIGRKDHKDLTSFLSFFAFDILIEEDEDSKMKLLASLGFKIPPFEMIDSNFSSFLKKTQNFINNGEYLIDGAVFTINSRKKQAELGYTAHHPKYKLAFKFKGEVKSSTIKAIDWQISKFGIYTPVALIEPIELTGALISKLTLHNSKTVRSFNLKIGDSIKIIRSGEVIPKFLEVDVSSSNCLDIPNTCTYCKSKLIEDEVRLACPNVDCTGRKTMYLLNFVKEVGIDSLSDKRVDLLIQNNLYNNIPDLYKLSKKELLSLDGVKDILATKIIKNIELSKTISVIKLFKALSFDGGSTFKTNTVIENGSSTLNDIFRLKNEELVKLKGFDKKSASDYISSIEKNKTVIKQLTDLGFNITFPEVVEKLNLKVCVTGTTSIPRKKIQEILKSKGISPVSSVSKNTDILICNEDNGSSKYKKAAELNITILTETEFKMKYNCKW